VVGRITTFVAALAVTIAISACSPGTPSPVVDLTGTWSGIASDAGAVRWTLRQSSDAVSGTMIFVDADGANVVSGSITGQVKDQRLTFEQQIGYFQFPATGAWSAYRQSGITTNGILAVFDVAHMTGNYAGAVSRLGTPSAPVGSGGPFTNGTLALRKE
jgi:hypothetical protein